MRGGREEAGIGRVLRGLRLERGLVLADLDALSAERGYRLSRARLSEIERGEAPIKLHDLVVLGHLYGIDPGDLLLEAETEAVAPAGVGDNEESPDELFEKGKSLYYLGKPLDAAWSFDAAARGRDPVERDARCLMLTSAAHAYERAGMMRLALRRGQQALDVLEEDAPTRTRAVAKVCILLCHSGARGRAYLYLTFISRAIEETRTRDRVLHATLLHQYNVALHLLGSDADVSIEDMEQVIAFFHEIGLPDRAARASSFTAKSLAVLGQIERALEFARQGAELADEEKNVDASLFARLVLGRCLSARAEYEQAEHVLRQVVTVAEPLGLQRPLDDAYELLAEMASRLDRPVDQEKWRRKRGKLRRTDGHPKPQPPISPFRPGDSL